LAALRMTSGRTWGWAECGYCDLRGAVEAEGYAHCADASIDVELKLSEVEVTLGKEFATGWKG